MGVKISKKVSVSYAYKTIKERDEAVEVFDKLGACITVSGFRSFSKGILPSNCDLIPGEVYPYIIVEYDDHID